MITQCSIRHLYTLDSSTTTPAQKNDLVALAKTFERRRCNHHTLEQPLSTLECYKDVIDPKSSGTNKNRYAVASQDEEVRRWCRGVRGVPMVYVKRSVMVMEPMAEGSLGVREGVERGKLKEGLRARGRGGVLLGEKRKREDVEAEEGSRLKVSGPDGDTHGPPDKKRKIRGPKGPNPLSVKKPKKKNAQSNDDERALLRKVEGPSTLEDAPQAPASIINEGPLDETHNPPGKRKRKRKHKPTLLEGLEATSPKSHATGGSDS